MPEQPDFNNAAALNSVWGRRALDLPIEVDLNALITAEDIAFLANRSIYIQVINSKAVLSGMVEPALISTEDGWTIHDYGEAMSVSSSTLLLEGLPEGKGTVVNQAFDVAREMVALAIKKGWSGIEVIAGIRLMEWSMWMAAEDQDFKVFGFEPTQQEKDKRARIKKLEGNKTPAQQIKLGND